MKLKMPPLHIQILLALGLGVVFGAILKVDPQTLIVSYKDEAVVKKQKVERFKEVRFIFYETKAQKEIVEVKDYGEDAQIQIVKYFKKLKPATKRRLIVEISYVNDKGKTATKKFENAVKLTKEPTIATQIKPAGDLFIRLLSFLAIPLVIASLIVGAASLEDVKKIGRIGAKTFIIYIITTSIAITIGLTAANLLKPGKKVDSQTKERLLGEFQDDSSEEIVEQLEVDVVNFFVEIVPKNPIKAMAKGNMLQIVFFAVLFGITLTFIEKRKSKHVVQFFDGVSDVMIKMVEFIMKIAPIGVFALIGATIAQFGFSIIYTLLWYIIAVLIGLLIQTLITYSFLAKFLGGLNPIDFLKGMRNAQAIAFSASSSAATLPVTINCAERNLGVPKQISGFVLPLGATINMDGTALYQGVAAVFIAQVYGFDLNIAQQLTVVITAVLASIGTAPVPGVGIIMLVIILQSVNVPPQGIALILGVDRILDMCRTVTNVTGDAAVASAIAGTERRRDKKIEK